jgi:hypothetical protein
MKRSDTAFNKPIICIVIIAMILTIFPQTVLASGGPYISGESDVQICQSLNLLSGEGFGITPEYLAKTSTRLQVAIISLRLTGKESDALAYNGTENFTDTGSVAWPGGKNVLSYLKSNPSLGWEGNPDGSFKPNDPATAQMIHKVMLESLGYKQNVDFSWDNIISFAKSIGFQKALNSNPFTNSALASVLVETENTACKESGLPFYKEHRSDIPIADYTEKINVLVDQTYALRHPDFDRNLNAIINDINAVFAKTTKKRFALNTISTYADDNELKSISSDEKYFYDNNFSSNPMYGGITVVFAHSDVDTSEKLNEYFKGVFGVYNTAFYTTAYLNGKTFGMVYISEFMNDSILMGSANRTTSYGWNEYENELFRILHELGHSLGLGSPEWYIKYTDQTPELPNLGTYNLYNTYPLDPMVGSYQWPTYTMQNFEFSPVNSMIINYNANHQYTCDQIADITKLVKINIKVTDNSGNPIVGATVKSYGGLSIAPDGGWQSALQDTELTKSNGITQISNVLYHNLPCLFIKVSSGTKTGGKIITLQDIETAYWSQNKSQYTVEIALNS